MALFENFVNRQILKYKAKRRMREMSNLSEKERLIFNIVKDSIHCSTAVLLIAPISGAKMIKIPEKDILIIFEGANIIINHRKFHYNMDISSELEHSLSTRFLKKMEHTHFLMKRAMMSGLLDGLHDIANRIEELNTINAKNYESCID